MFLTEVCFGEDEFSVGVWTVCDGEDLDVECCQVAQELVHIEVLRSVLKNVPRKAYP